MARRMEFSNWPNLGWSGVNITKPPGLTDSEGDFSKGGAEVRETKNGQPARLDEGAQKR